MPIEFFCPECEAFLRTPDEKAGQSATCPACGHHIWIPWESEEFAEDEAPDSPPPVPTGRQKLPSELELPPSLESSPPEPESPREEVFCPECSEANDPDADECWNCAQPLSENKPPQRITKVAFSSILRVSWKIYSENLGICVVASVIDFLLTLAALAMLMVPVGISVAILEQTPEVAALTVTVIFLIGSLVSLSALWIGHIRFYLALVRGERPNLSEIFHFGPAVGRMACACFWFFSMLGIGVMCCFIPALFICALYWPFGRCLVESDVSAFKSLSQAYSLTKDYFWVSIGLVTLSLFVSLIAQVLVLGIVFAFPFHGVLFTVAYLHFSGEFVNGRRHYS